MADNAVDVGPWGGDEGTYREVDGDILKITVQYGDVVDSLVIEYIEGGIEKVSPKFGGEGKNTKEITLEDGEHLVTIKGWVTDDVVSSLTFITSKNSDGIGPFGKASGKEFSLPVKAGNNAGLFGFFGNHLNAIGVRLLPPNQAGVNAVYVGPWGGDPKKDKELYELGFWEVYGDIRKINVQYGNVVDSLIIEYIKGGYKKTSVRFGGEGENTEEIPLINDEYLVTIKGTIKWTIKEGEKKDGVLSSLTFFTNLHPKGIGPFGKESEDGFSLPMKAGKIVGLFGFVDPDLNCLQCIGVSLVPPSNPPNQADNAVDVGPLGGQPKDKDGFWELHGDIQKITVNHDDVVVHSLIIKYIKGGIKKQLVRFGGEGGEKKGEIILGVGEYLVTIKGRKINDLVSSLTFITNQRTYGPFGNESGEEFSLLVKVGQIAGLFGFAGKYLNAIGVGLVPPPNKGTVELGPWGGDGGTTRVYDKEIRSFQVASDGEGIVSITFNGSDKFGGSGGTQSELVYLKSGEYLLSIEGATGKPVDNSILKTIGFVSNKKTYGPYPENGVGDVSFDSPVKNGKIVGFTGRQGERIYAIGIKVAQVTE